jgi:hypothetical protein
LNKQVRPESLAGDSPCRTLPRNWFQEKEALALAKAAISLRMMHQESQSSWLQQASRRTFVGFSPAWLGSFS